MEKQRVETKKNQAGGCIVVTRYRRGMTVHIDANSDESASGTGAGRSVGCEGRKSIIHTYVSEDPKPLCTVCTRTKE